jgi:hypothetical protein
VLRAVLTGDVAVMPDHVALVWRFTRATLEHDASADRFVMTSNGVGAGRPW